MEKISVVMATYNSSKFIQDQLLSIISQDYKSMEIIIVDDFSTDDTINIIHKVLGPSVDYILLQNDKNLGYIKSFEIGINYAKGDFIFLVDHDDIWHPLKIEYLIKESKKNFKMCYFTNGELINEENNKLGDNLFHIFNAPRNRMLLSNNDYLFRRILKKNFITGATLMFHRSLVKHILPFPSMIVHDKWISIVSSMYLSLQGINEKLIFYRIHEKQTIGIKKTKLSFQNTSFVFNKEIEFLQTLLSRAPANFQRIDYICERLSHFKNRKKIVEKNDLRLFLFELITLRYFIHSNGFSSIFMDIIRLCN
jgi:glycosyltransferase involved in cell wall biosynthesis